MRQDAAPTIQYFTTQPTKDVTVNGAAAILPTPWD
jgi:hypothetical protein